MMDLIPRDPSGNPAYPHQSMPELMLPPQQGVPASDGGILLRLRRRKLLFAFVFLLVLGLVTAAYMYLPPSYRAEASITVSPPERILASQQGADAAQTIGDPELFWRICDANRAMRPEDLTDVPGRRLVITLPEGVQGAS